MLGKGCEILQHFQNPRPSALRPGQPPGPPSCDLQPPRSVLQGTWHQHFTTNPAAEPSGAQLNALWSQHLRIKQRFAH